MTTPVTPTPPYGPGDPNRPGNRKLAGKLAALSVLIATVVTVTVRQSGSGGGGATPPVDTTHVVSATGCPASTPGAVVVRFADATTSGVVPRADITPLVICGAKPIAYAMQTYVQWVAAGPCPCSNGPVRDTTTNPFDKVVLSPADTSASAFDPLDSMAVRRDSTHWVLPDSAHMRWKLLGGMLYTVMSQAQVPGVRDPTPVPIIGWWSYVPVMGAMSRTQLSVNPTITAADSTLNLTLMRSAPDSS